MAKNYAATAFALSSALDKRGEYEEAITAIEFAKRFAEEPMFLYNEALIYFKRGDKASADSVLEILLEREAGDRKLVKEVARIYGENGMNQRAVKILASYLEEHPMDKEILDLIEKYQEE
jgi:Flp pilus assembly protein TadD